MKGVPIKGPPLFCKKYSLKEKEDFQNHITELVKLGAVVKCSLRKNQYVSPIFLTPKSNGSKRFILNLKKFNEFVIAPHFKLEDTRTVLRLIQKDWFMATIDLKDAYFSVPVHKKYRKFLRFSFNDSLYQFTCLCFGLASAPYAFTKILKPVLQFFRNLGIIVANYLDDFLIMAPSFLECQNNVNFVVKQLKCLGFVINNVKSNLKPTQICRFLGFIFNTKKMILEIPLEKREKTKIMLKRIIPGRKLKIKEFARLIGTLVSLCPAVKYGWLYTKRLEQEKCRNLNKNNQNYENTMIIHNNIIPDICWWLKNIDITYNNIKQDNYALEIFTDASKTGYGACAQGQRSHGWWTENEANNHINFLELKAIFWGLKTFATNLKHCNVLIRSDNKTAISYINRMGSIKYLNLSELSRLIWQWCEERDLWIFASYIPSKENWEADQESRTLKPETEWRLAHYAFKTIVKTFGVPNIDLFASQYNNKCKRYASWQVDPGAEVIDAFTLFWGNIKFYAFPPFSLILRTVQKIIKDKSEGILVVPNWKTQPWFPLLSKIIINKIVFPPNRNLLFSSSRKQHPLASNLSLVAAHVSGKLLS